MPERLCLNTEVPSGPRHRRQEERLSVPGLRGGPGLGPGRCRLSTGHAPASGAEVLRKADVVQHAVQARPEPHADPGQEAGPRPLAGLSAGACGVARGDSLAVGPEQSRALGLSGVLCQTWTVTAPHARG